MEIIIALVLMFSLFSLLWLYHLKSKEADIVDAGWAFGLGLLGIFYAIISEGDLTRRVLLAFMVYAWSFRLGGYIFFNRVLKPGEDARYLKLREKWGEKSNFYFFLFFQAQGLLSILLAGAFLIIARNHAPFGAWTDVAAILVWFTGLYGEVVADAHMSQWRANPENKGKTCRGGLWKYSRHPNYFFESIHWCAYPLLAASEGFFSFAFAAISPIIITYLVLKVTGIPPTEAAALESRYDYRDYQRTTSAFIPWFPKKSEN